FLQGQGAILPAAPGHEHRLGHLRLRATRYDSPTPVEATAQQERATAGGEVFHVFVASAQQVLETRRDRQAGQRAASSTQLVGARRVHAGVRRQGNPPCRKSRIIVVVPIDRVA